MSGICEKNKIYGEGGPLNSEICAGSHIDYVGGQNTWGGQKIKMCEGGSVKKKCGEGSAKKKMCGEGSTKSTPSPHLRRSFAVKLCLTDESYCF